MIDQNPTEIERVVVDKEKGTEETAKETIGLMKSEAEDLVKIIEDVRDHDRQERGDGDPPHMIAANTIEDGGLLHIARAGGV